MHHRYLLAWLLLLLTWFEAPAAAAEPEGKPAAADRWVIGVVADNRGGTGTHGAILKHFQKGDVQLILNVGDMVYPAPGGEWDGIVKQFREVYGEKEGDEFLARRVFVTAGGWDEQYINQAQKLKDRGDQPEEKRSKRSRLGYEPDNAAGQEFYQRYFKYKDRAGKPDESIVEYTPQGDYHVKFRGVHLLSLYITDEWPNLGKKYHQHDDPESRRAAIEKQAVWLRAKLKEIRAAEPRAPLIVMAHKGSWYNGGGPLADMAKALAEFRVDVALSGDGHIYNFVRDTNTLKLMVPGAFSDSSDGYFLIGITPSTGAIDVDHFRYTGELKHQHHKIAGEKMTLKDPKKK